MSSYYGTRNWQPPTRGQRFTRWLTEWVKALSIYGFVAAIFLFVGFVLLLPFMWWGFIVWAVVKLLAILSAAVGVR